MRPRALLTTFALLLAAGAVGPLVPRAAAAPGDAVTFDAAVRALRTAKDPVERIDAIRLLATYRDASVPRRLADVVRNDEDPVIRAEAAEALGTAAHDDVVDRVFDLLRDGGTRDVRSALCRALRARGVAVTRVVREIRAQADDPLARGRLVDALASYPDAIAAGHLDHIARTEPDVCESALLGLESHAYGKGMLPDLVADLLATSQDVDVLVPALGTAARFGDDRVRMCGPRLASMQRPVVDSALEGALQFMAWKKGPQGGADPSVLPRIRDRVDQVHVFSLVRDTPSVWGRIRAELTNGNPRWEDVRVGIVCFLEPGVARPKLERHVLPFTRDEAKVDAFFKGVTMKLSNPRGPGMATALNDAFTRSDWRWDATRRVVLHSWVAPSEARRARATAALYYRADGTILNVWYSRVGSDRDLGALRELASSGGGVVIDEGGTAPRDPKIEGRTDQPQGGKPFSR